MGKIIITYNEISDINHLLENKELNYKVHLHDACGSQSFTIDSLAENSEEQSEGMKAVVEEYFQAKNLTIRFFDDNKGFVFM